MAPARGTFTPDQVARYARHLILPEVGGAGQRKLLNSSVLLLGAGGLGSPAAMYLAAAGVGKIGIVDFDVVDKSNLQRQLLHGVDDVGRPKVESAARTLRGLNPDVEVVPINEHLNSDTAMRIFAPYDVIVDGTDNFPTRYLANDAAHFLGKPLVHGSIFRFEGRLALFDSAKGTGCYRCLFPEPPPPGSVQSCAEAGVFGVLPGIIGSMMAFETIKYLLDIGRPMIGRYLLFEGEDMTFRELRLRQLDSYNVTRLDDARRIVRGLGSVLIAYSGGVDSTLLLRLAMDELGDRAVAVLASSPAYPESEQRQARDLAREMGVRLVEVNTNEVELEEYVRNNPDRCFHCKEELFDTVEPVQRQLGLAHLAYGATADDQGAHRPGHGSAVRRGVRFPLLDAGMTKAEIRAAARTLGLPNWNKPSFACLSSRIPHGTPVTIEALSRIGRAESALRELGFRQVRVRHHQDVARVEVDQAEMEQALALRERIVAG